MSQGWTLKALDKKLSAELAAKCDISTLLAEVMVVRGFKDTVEIVRFLNPDLTRDWSDPVQIPGLSAVCDVLEQAIRSNKSILVFGDFDTDGISATALMLRGLEALGRSADYIIPNRIDEGYGLTAATLERIIAKHPDLVVTVDCGISSKPEVEQLLASGIDVVVTDHHEPSTLVPDSVAVADPKLAKDSLVGELAGVGVAMKVMAELGRRFNKPELWQDLIDLTALGTIADMMPLLQENRSLVAAGLAKMQQHPRPGLAALLELTGKPRAELSAKDVSFSVTPRLNAAGRMGDPKLALQLLIDDDPVRAHDNALALDSINSERKEAENLLYREALAQLDDDPHTKKVIIVAGNDWHEGVKGIIASRLAKRFGVPALVFSLVDGQARASGRSVGAINLFKAVESCADFLIRFGGHEAAVGVTLNEADLPKFKSRIEEWMSKVPDGDFRPVLQLDGELELDQLSVEAVTQLERLEPFGQDNEEPLFISKKLYLKNRRAVGANKNHFSFLATDGKTSLAGIWFNPERIDDHLNSEDAVDIIYRPSINEWNGRRTVNLNVVEIFKAENIDEVKHLDLSDTDIAVRFVAERGAQLHDVQRRSLADLDRGNSIMTIMPTGRGKSLIFQIHAAKLALQGRGATVIIYPLRALIADQYLHIKDSFASLGLQARVLTGELSATEKDAVFSDLYESKIDIILTTPEFFQLHIWRFAACKRVAFITFDEAHHLASTASEREAYKQLLDLHNSFDKVQIFATTATADDEVCTTICERLKIDKVIVGDHLRSNLLLNDERTCSDREAKLLEIVSGSAKSVVYVNSRYEAVDLVRLLRKHTSRAGEHAKIKAIFYHAGLTKQMRSRIESGFRFEKYNVLVATSAFGEGVNIPDIRDVVLYSLPFSLLAFNQMSGRVGRDGKPAHIHLLFKEQDIEQNRAVLSHHAPTRSQLVTIYRAIKLLRSKDKPSAGYVHKAILMDELGKLCRAIDTDVAQDESMLMQGLAIFAELGLIRFDKLNDDIYLELLDDERRVDLESSSLYREGRTTLQHFDEFCTWAFSASADNIRATLVSAVVPEKMVRDAVQ